MRLRKATGAVIVLLLGSFATATADQPWQALALQRFNDQVARYMALRHELQIQVGVPVVTSNPADIVRNTMALAIAIRKARPHAQAGDVFNDVIAFELRQRIHRVLEQHHVSNAELLEAGDDESPRHAAKLIVNGAFDWGFGGWMPASIIAVLPSVPQPLEYRFVADDLVLLDIDASLIVDVVRRALIEP